MLSDPITLTLLALCALLLGISKTGLPALGIAAIGIMALVIPAKGSIGLILLLLIIGDIAAVINYRKHANLELLKTLLPFIFVGIGIGAFVLNDLDEQSIRPFLGMLIIALLGIDQLRRYSNWEKLEKNRALAAVIGLLAGFCTVTGNIAGPLMLIYFIFLGMPKYILMGTGAWLFLIVNLVKVPVFISINVINTQTIYAFLWLAPFTLAGTFVGVKLLKHINQALFEKLIVLIALGSALWLMSSTFMY